MDSSFLCLVEPSIPEGFDDFAKRQGVVPGEWSAVSQTWLRNVHRPPDFDDLCRYAYARGFNRGLKDDRDESWAYGSVFVVARTSPGEPFGVRELQLSARLIDETRDTELGHLLAELRVMGESHAKRYVPQEATV